MAWMERVRVDEGFEQGSLAPRGAREPTGSTIEVRSKARTTHNIVPFEA